MYPTTVPNNPLINFKRRLLGMIRSRASFTDNSRLGQVVNGNSQDLF